VLTFYNGCLFGGIDCIKGTHYSDEEARAFCSGRQDPFANGHYFIRTELNVGEYDSETQSWQITRTVTEYIGTGATLAFAAQQKLVLERE
jgi:hypothetical protein